MPDMKSLAAKFRELVSLLEEPQVEVFAEEGATTARLFLPFAEPSEWINYLPTPGRYEHKAYGTVEITPERAANFVATFKAGAYQSSIPIDLEHGIKSSGAAGWIEDMRLNESGGVDAKVNWTDMGREVLARDRFRYFSPEIADTWTSPLGVTHKDVAIGGALTTRPFFKEASLRKLAASEEGDQKPPQEGDMSDEKPKGDEAPQGDPKPTNEAPAQFSEQRFAEIVADNQRLANENKSFSERLALMETANRRRAFTEEYRGKSDANNIRWFGEEAEHVEMMEKLAKAFGEDSPELAAYIKQNREAAKRIHSSGVFSQTGVSGVPLAGSDAEKLDAAVKAYTEKNPNATPEQARAAVFSENPELVRAMRAKTPTNTEAS